MKPHHATFRVYYEDTDAAGIVYYANYLKFAERARTDWLRALGIEQAELMAKSGIGFVVRRCEIDFMAPAKLDDLITIESRLQELGKVRMTMQQTVTCKKTELVKLSVELACVSRKQKPVRLPDVIVQAFKG